MLELFTQDQIKAINALVSLYKGHLGYVSPENTEVVEDIDVHETWILDVISEEGDWTIYDGEVVMIEDIEDPEVIEYVNANKAFFLDEDEALELLDFLQDLDVLSII